MKSPLQDYRDQIEYSQEKKKPLMKFDSQRNVLSQQTDNLSQAKEKMKKLDHSISNKSIKAHGLLEKSMSVSSSLQVP